MQAAPPHPLHTEDLKVSQTEHTPSSSVDHIEQLIWQPPPELQKTSIHTSLNDSYELYFPVELTDKDYIRRILDIVSNSIRPYIIKIVAEDKNSKTSRFLEEIKGSDYDIYYQLKLLLGKTYEKAVPEKALAVSRNFKNKLVTKYSGAKFTNSADILLGSRSGLNQPSREVIGAKESDVDAQFLAARSLLECFCVSCDLGLLQLKSLETQYHKHKLFKEERMKALLCESRHDNHHVDEISAPSTNSGSNHVSTIVDDSTDLRDDDASDNLIVDAIETESENDIEIETDVNFENEEESDEYVDESEPTVSRHVVEMQFASIAELIAHSEQLREKLACLTSTAPHASHTTLLVVLQALTGDLASQSNRSSAQSDYDEAERLHAYKVMLERTMEADVFVQTTPSEGGNGVQRIENMYKLCSQADSVVPQLGMVELKARQQHQFSKCKSLVELSNDIASSSGVLRKLLTVDPIGSRKYPNECHLFFIQKLHETNRSLFDLLREAHNMKLFQYVIHHWPLHTKNVRIKSTKTQPRLSDLKKAGYTAADLRSGGYNALELKICGYSAAEVISVGCTASDLKAAGYEASELKKAKFGVVYLKSAGYTASDLKLAGYTAASLGGKSLGGNTSSVASDGQKDGYYGPSTPDSERYNTYDVTHAGYGAAELKAAGYDVYDLQRAGYRTLALRKVDFNTEDMRMAGYSASEMKGGGYSADDLLDAGYDFDDVLRAGYTAAYLKKNNFCAADLMSAGYSVLHLQDAGFSTSEVTAAGYSAADLKRGGYTACDLPVDSDSGHTYSATECKQAGYALTELVQAKYSTRELKEAGYCAVKLKPFEPSIRHMKQIGFTASEMRAAGYSVSELMAVRYKISAMKKAGYTAADLEPFYVSATHMKSGGYGAAELREVGYSAATLKEAGYGMDDIVRAGYPASELKAVYGRGNSAPALRRAGYTALDLADAKYRILDLKHANYSATEMKKAGYSVSDLKNVGYSFIELRSAGYEL